MVQPAKEFHIGDVVGHVDLDAPTPRRAPDTPQWRLAEVGRLAGIDCPGAALARAGFESYRPVVTVSKRCGPLRKMKRRRVPLLHRYLFVNVAVVDMPVAATAHLAGVAALRGFVTVTGGCAVIPVAEIERLRLRCAEGGFDGEPLLSDMPHFSAGDLAIVRAGPFCDFGAVIESVMGDRARVMIDIFGRATPAEMPLLALEGVE